jgi:hypothetical protein
MGRIVVCAILGEAIWKDDLPPIDGQEIEKV